MDLEIKHASVSDATIIHSIMMKAFMKHKDEDPPSSALEETVESVVLDLTRGEQALISFLDNQPVGIVRFQFTDASLYFFRLAVIPEKQGLGIAKMMVRYVEACALQKGFTKVFCKVRMSLPGNIAIYESIGYKINEKELVYKSNGSKIQIVSMVKRLDDQQR